jgi:hypothetical protein
MKALRKFVIKLVANYKIALGIAAAIAALVVALGYGDSSYYKFAAPGYGQPGFGDISRINGLPGWGDITRIFN